MAYKTFPEMISTLRAAKAAGMDCEISLTADSAGELADILETHQRALEAAIHDAHRSWPTPAWLRSLVKRKERSVSD